MFLPYTQQDRVANIVGIDPGSQTLGLCVLSFDIVTLDIISTQAKTFYGDRLPQYDKFIATAHGDRVARILAHKQNIKELLYYYKPIIVASESPFFNTRRPNAFAALLEVLTMIRDSVIEYNPYQPLIGIDPPTVKKAVGAPGNADKTGVLSALVRISNSLKLDQKYINQLDEHSVDAIAVSYCAYVSQILNRQ